MNTFAKILEEEKELRWTSFSFLDITTAIQIIGGLGDSLEIRFSPGNDYLQSEGFNIRFSTKDYGCDLHIYAWKSTKDFFAFTILWAYLQGKRKVHGGKYKKEFNDLWSEMQDKQGEKLAKALDDIPDKNARYTPRLMKYVVRALEKSNKAPEKFLSINITYLAQLIEEEREQVIQTFKKEYQGNDDFNPDHVGLNSYCSTGDTLRDWTSKYGTRKRKPKKKTQK